MECNHLSPRRRKRLKYYKARHELLVIIVCSLNFEVLGFPQRPPASARSGAAISPAQHEVLERLESMLDHFMHMPTWVPDELGRPREKFEMLIHQIKELPKCTLGLQDLFESLQSLHGSFDPYQSHFARSSAYPSDPDHDTHRCPATGVAMATANSDVSAKPVISSRVKWENPPSCRAQEFLDDPLLKAAFDDPEVLRKPLNQWGNPAKGKMHCTKDEFLKLVSRWDDLNACSLLPVQHKDMDEAVGLFCVPKDSTYDRLIINPRTINSRMFSISRSTKELAPGCLLGLLHLAPDESYRFSADDLSDFYKNLHH